jgi:hypothetical protein
MPTSACGGAGRRRRTCGVRKARLARRRVRPAGGHRLCAVSCRWVLHPACRLLRVACCMLHAACCSLRAATWDRTGGAVRCICVLQRRGVTRNRQCQPSNICPPRTSARPPAHADAHVHAHAHRRCGCASVRVCVRACVCVCVCACVRINVRTWACMYLCMYVRTYVCEHACMGVWMGVSIRIHTYPHVSARARILSHKAATRAASARLFPRACLCVCVSVWFFACRSCFPAGTRRRWRRAATAAAASASSAAARPRAADLTAQSRRRPPRAGRPTSRPLWCASAEPTIGRYCAPGMHTFIRRSLDGWMDR